MLCHSLAVSLLKYVVFLTTCTPNPNKKSFQVCWTFWLHIFPFAPFSFSNVFFFFLVLTRSLPIAVLADNLKSNPGIKWQYFSSEEGIFTVFPAHKFHCKGNYEHRSRYRTATVAYNTCCCTSAVFNVNKYDYRYNLHFVSKCHT